MWRLDASGGWLLHDPCEVDSYLFYRDMDRMTRDLTLYIRLKFDQTGEHVVISKIAIAPYCDYYRVLSCKRCLVSSRRYLGHVREEFFVKALQWRRSHYDDRESKNQAPIQ